MIDIAFYIVVHLYYHLLKFEIETMPVNIYSSSKGLNYLTMFH